MGPKVEAACAFVEATGGSAGIGSLSDALSILQGTAGTSIKPNGGNLAVDS
jgi:carbamate kinase